MMAMSFECKDCDYKVHSRVYAGYDIVDGKKVYAGHPGDGFCKFKERPYIHKETHVIKWFEENEKIPEEYIYHCAELVYANLVARDKGEDGDDYIPHCPNCKIELKMSGFIGCM